jgi:hypothetical protein
MPAPGVASAPQKPIAAESFAVHDPVEVPLIAIAHARSGDKGADANIGVRARHPDFLPLLRDQLSAEVVAEWMSHLIGSGTFTQVHNVVPTFTQVHSVVPVERYDLPGIDALNFVLRDALGGGGIASLRFDAQGKGYAQQLLDLPLKIPTTWQTHPAIKRGQSLF